MEIVNTQDYAPVRHSQWGYKGTAYGCMNCGFGVIAPIYNYCPNCGALMSDEVAGKVAPDSVVVVRCRDCKYGKLCFDADGHGLIQCTNPYYPASFAETWPFDLDWYCAGGERRDERG